MTKRLLQQLVLASYTNNILDAKKVAKLSTTFDKRDLKAYIRALKLMEQEKRIYVAMPEANLYNIHKKDLQKLFPGKELIFQEDPTLLLGIQLIDNDIVYEASLRDRLNSILEELEQQYES